MLIYQYSGGLDGFLSAVFLAYRNRELPDLLTDGELTEQPLCSNVITVIPDEAKALRVERGIMARLGGDGLHQLSYAYASCDPQRNLKLFYWVLSVFKYGAEVQKRYQDPNVMNFCDMTARVTLEINHTLGFLRFSQTKEGLYFAEFAPDNNILPFIMPHFTKRFSDQSFIITDRKRKLYGIYNREEWKVIASDTLITPEYSEPETVFRSLWKEYFRSVSIAARENRKLQDSYLPRRYRVFLTEFRDVN